MNVYDFDNTIYDGESSVDFFMFCLKKRPKLIKYIFVVFFNLAKYKLCLISKQELLKLAEKNLFGILDICPDYEKLAESFWDKSMNKIKPLYLDNKRKDDVIISASFDFLLKLAEFLKCFISVVFNFFNSANFNGTASTTAKILRLRAYALRSG